MRMGRRTLPVRLRKTITVCSTGRRYTPTAPQRPVVSVDSIRLPTRTCTGICHRQTRSTCLIRSLERNGQLLFMVDKSSSDISSKQPCSCLTQDWFISSKQPCSCLTQDWFISSKQPCSCLTQDWFISSKQPCSCLTQDWFISQFSLYRIKWATFTNVSMFQSLAKYYY